jgi:hypothetical protein
MLQSAEGAAVGDYSAQHFDFVWGSNSSMLEETGISLVDNLGKAVVQDLCGDPLSFVLIINQFDTLSTDRFVEASHWLFDGQSRGASDDAAQIKMVGVARIRKSKQGYAFETYLTGKPTLKQVVDLMSDDLQGRLSPAAKFIPFNNPFSSIVELPTVSWQMGEYLTHEMAEADTPLRRGGGRAGLQAAVSSSSSGTTGSGNTAGRLRGRRCQHPTTSRPTTSTHLKSWPPPTRPSLRSLPPSTTTVRCAWATKTSSRASSPSPAMSSTQASGR